MAYPKRTYTDTEEIVTYQDMNRIEQGIYDNAQGIINAKSHTDTEVLKRVLKTDYETDKLELDATITKLKEADIALQEDINKRVLSETYVTGQAAIEKSIADNVKVLNEKNASQDLDISSKVAKDTYAIDKAATDKAIAEKTTTTLNGEKTNVNLIGSSAELSAINVDGNILRFVGSDDNFIVDGIPNKVISDVKIMGFKKNEYISISNIRNGYLTGSLAYGVTVYNADEAGKIGTTIYNFNSSSKPVGLQTHTFNDGTGKSISFKLDWNTIDNHIPQGTRIATQNKTNRISLTKYYDLPDKAITKEQIHDSYTEYIINYMLQEFKPFVFTNSLKTDRPIITLVDDDGTETFLTKVKPVLESYNKKCTLAVIPYIVGNSGKLNLEQLKTLQSEGYEILSHTWAHEAKIFKESAIDMTNVTDEAISQEFKLAYDYMLKNGFTTDTIVYPWGDWSSNQAKRIKKIAKQYHQFGINSNGGCMNDKVLDNMYYSRVFVTDNKGLSYYTNIIDDIIQNNGWLILGTHSNDSGLTQAFLQSVIDYAIQRNVEILNFKEANTIKKNIVSVGIWGESVDSMFLGRDGITIAN